MPSQDSIKTISGKQNTPVVGHGVMALPCHVCRRAKHNHFLVGIQVSWVALSNFSQDDTLSLDLARYILLVVVSICFGGESFEAHPIRSASCATAVKINERWLRCATAFPTGQRKNYSCFNRSTHQHQGVAIRCWTFQVTFSRSNNSFTKMQVTAQKRFTSIHSTKTRLWHSNHSINQGATEVTSSQILNYVPCGLSSRDCSCWLRPARSNW
jgi:hypothetical protein